MAQHPIFSIVTVLYNKGRQLPYFLESLTRQTFPGEIEVIMVDDQSIDHSVDFAYDLAGRIKKVDPRISIKIFENQENLGNCLSRNKGVALASGEFLVIIDADCLLSKNFLEEYHRCFKDSDVVVSNFGIELCDRPALPTLEMYEQNPPWVIRDRKIQDAVQPNSFLNCVTRGVAIRREFVSESLYDPQFSYSAGRGSGYGWEDIDAGYQLFETGARIAFASKAFSLHMTHPAATDESVRAAKSLKNYRRLHQKNPRLASVKKDWSLNTYREIGFWLLKTNHHSPNEDKKFLDRHLGVGANFHLSLQCQHLIKKYRESLTL
jgi:glycosyltransferase involved in cell wall biosynthesis